MYSSRRPDLQTFSEDHRWFPGKETYNSHIHRPQACIRHCLAKGTLSWRWKMQGLMGTSTDGQTIQIEVNDGISSKATLRVLSWVINDLPELLTLEKALYADDLAMWNSSKHPSVSRRIIRGPSPKVAKQKQNIQIQGHQLEKRKIPYTWINK